MDRGRTDNVVVEVLGDTVVAGGDAGVSSDSLELEEAGGFRKLLSVH